MMVKYSSRAKFFLQNMYKQFMHSGEYDIQNIIEIIINIWTYVLLVNIGVKYTPLSLSELKCTQRWAKIPTTHLETKLINECN